MKKSIAVLLMLVMVICFCSCGESNNVNTNTTASTTVAATTATQQIPGYPYTIKDQVGRDVTVKTPPTKVATIYGVAVTYMAAFGAEDMLVSKSDGIVSPCLYDYIAPDVLKLPNAGSKQPDLEKIASLGADMYIGRGRDKAALDAVSGINIPSLGINPETTEEVLATYDLFGKILGKEARAEELKAAYKGIIDKASSLVANIPADKRKSAIVMGSEIGKVANSSMLQSFLISTAGGINPAAEIETNELWPTVGVEQIFNWDPDFIFVTSYGSTKYGVDDIMNDKTWAGVSAVKNHKVLKTPSDLESWEIPGPSSALGTLWMVRQMYPEVYSAVDLQKDVEAYYEILYPGNTFTPELLGYGDPIVESKYPYTVKDQVGREVEIKEAPTKVSTVYAVAITYMTAMGVDDLLVNKNGGIKSPCIYDYVAPEVVNLPVAGSKQPDLEKLASLGTNFYIGRGRDTATLDAVTNMGVSAIGINPETVEEVFATYDLLGQVFGIEERAEELKATYKAITDKAAALVADIPADKRKTAIVMGSDIGNVANGAMLQSYLITTAGGINPAVEIKTNELWPLVGVEQIFNWNPDFIFVTSNGATNYTVEDILKDKNWAGVSAVQNGKVLKTPSSLESWELPGPSSALGTLWMVRQMYPDVYSDADFQKDVEDYYAVLYPGNTFTCELLGY